MTATVVGSHYVGEYSAESGDAALEMAMDDASVSVCHQCARDIEDPELTTFVAESEDGDVVERRDEPTWEEQARAAGWTPPRAKKGRRA